jgi:hypothetical protein
MKELIYDPYDEEDVRWLKEVCRVAKCEPLNLLDKAQKIMEAQK